MRITLTAHLLPKLGITIEDRNTTLTIHVLFISYSFHLIPWNLMKRGLRFVWQKIRYGFSEAELWSLYQETSEFLLPRLKEFVQYDMPKPYGLTAEEWKEILQNIIFYHECMVGDKYSYEDQSRFELGKQQFSEYYGALWF